MADAGGNSPYRRVVGVENPASNLHPRRGARGGSATAPDPNNSQSHSVGSVLPSEASSFRKMKITVENSADQGDRRRAALREVGLAVVLFSFVCACYIAYSYLQEMLMRVPVYGNKKFDYPVFLVFMCFAVNLVTTGVLMGGMQLKLNRDHRANMDPEAMRPTVFDMLDKVIALLGSLAATTNVLAMVLSLVAIKYIGVPSQIIIKSAKMIPILIGGFVLFRKRYPLYDYVCVVLITACIFAFNFFKPSKGPGSENTPFGICMCLLSLLCDGITGPIEDKMLSLKDLHPYLLLFILNFFGFPVALVAVFLAEGTTPFVILARHPELWAYVLGVAVAASVGQVFIVLCLKLYGSLYTTLITTIRKIVSSLISIFSFNHPMSAMQWVSMSGTFMILFARQYIKYRMSAKGKKGAAPGGH